jgi:hypothetical protein
VELGWFFFSAVLGLELRAYLSHSSGPIFVKGFFLTERLIELFAWAGFELRSS